MPGYYRNRCTLCVCPLDLYCVGQAQVSDAHCTKWKGNRTKFAPMVHAWNVTMGPDPFMLLPGAFESLVAIANALGTAMGSAVKQSAPNPHLARIAQADACPAKGRQIEGGCNCTWECTAGRGFPEKPGETARNRCLACLDEPGCPATGET